MRLQESVKRFLLTSFAALWCSAAREFLFYVVVCENTLSFIFPHILNIFLFKLNTVVPKIWLKLCKSAVLLSLTSNCMLHLCSRNLRGVDHELKINCFHFYSLKNVKTSHQYFFLHLKLIFSFDLFPLLCFFESEKWTKLHKATFLSFWGFDCEPFSRTSSPGPASLIFKSFYVLNSCAKF